MMYEYITLDGLLSLLGGAKQRRGEEYICVCPAHPDHDPSLWIRENEKGLMLKCRAGCSTDAICQALGIKMGQLFRDSRGGSPAPSKPAAKPAAKPERLYGSYEEAYRSVGRVVKVYPYTNRDGKLLFEVARIMTPKGEKTFRQHRPADPKKGTFPIIKSVPAEIREGALYRLPEVVDAIERGETVYVVEGEKDADTLADWGLCGTTCPGGAKSWTRAHSERLAGADVVIVPDNDEVGEAHGQQVADSTIDLAKRVRLIHLREGFETLPPKGDITDLAELAGADRAQRILHELEEKAAELGMDLYRKACAAYAKVPGYCVNGGCICQRVDEGARTLSTFVALPTREITQDDGAQVEKYLEIMGWDMKGRPLERVQVSMESFGGMNWPLKHWGLAANVMPGSTVKDKLRYAVTAVGAEEARQAMIYAHTGWRKIGGRWAYLYPGGCVGAEDVEVQLEDKLTIYTLEDAPADLGRREAAAVSRRLLDVIHPAISVPLMGVMYLAPLAEWLRQTRIGPSFLTMLKGGTSTHKSTVAALFLSHFGRFSYDMLPAHFTDTVNTVRKLAFTLKDMPLVIDDYHPEANLQERRKMESIAQLLSRAFGDNADRGRLDGELRLRKSMPPRAVGIVTGEELPDVGESGIGRYYIIEVERGSIDLSDELTEMQTQALRGTLQAAMRGYIEWVGRQADDLPQRLNRLFMSYRKRARESLSGSKAHDRSAPAIAHIMIGITAMEMYWRDIGLITQEEASAELEQYWSMVVYNAAEQAITAREERPLEMYMNAVREMLESHAVCVVPMANPDSMPERGSVMVGYSDANNYYFIAGTLFGQVVKYYAMQNRVFSAQEKALYQMMREEGIAQPDSGGRITRLKRIGGKNMRLLWIPRWRIDGGEPPTPAGEQMTLAEDDEDNPFKKEEGRKS